MTDLTEDFRAAEPIWTRPTAYAAGAVDHPYARDWAYAKN